MVLVTVMQTVRLQPIELCRLAFGDDWKIAEITGVSRAQTVQRWQGIPVHHIPKLVDASRVRGRFALTADMLIFGAEAELAALGTPSQEDAA